MYCDFCNLKIEEGQDYVTYKILPIVLINTHGKGCCFDSDWAACGKCYKMIEERRWGDLTEYVAKRYSEDTGVPLEDSRRAAYEVMQLFQLVWNASKKH